LKSIEIIQNSFTTLFLIRLS